MGTNDGDQIGGLVKNDPETQKTNAGSLGQPPKSDSGGGSSGGGLDGLDIFSQEEAGDEEENRLAALLPEVDINDLLRECREVAAELAEGVEES
ncbi:MAG: hypothetical protein HQ553_17630 [Chloroflexi bacterium]|nr:hypothetical protein [Chloroflexota bacterium]